jgi:hypothetical protein
MAKTQTPAAGHTTAAKTPAKAKLKTAAWTGARREKHAKGVPAANQHSPKGARPSLVRAPGKTTGGAKAAPQKGAHALAKGKAAAPPPINGWEYTNGKSWLRGQTKGGVDGRGSAAPQRQSTLRRRGAWNA